LGEIFMSDRVSIADLIEIKSRFKEIEIENQKLKEINELLKKDVDDAAQHLASEICNAYAVTDLATSLYDESVAVTLEPVRAKFNMSIGPLSNKPTILAFVLKELSESLAQKILEKHLAQGNRL
jgi:hypothetical protein